MALTANVTKLNQSLFSEGVRSKSEAVCMVCATSNLVKNDERLWRRCVWHQERSKNHRVTEPSRRIVAISDISTINVDMFSVRLSLAPICSKSTVVSSRAAVFPHPCEYLVDDAHCGASGWYKAAHLRSHSHCVAKKRVYQLLLPGQG